jgi:hypothetical protein
MISMESGWGKNELGGFSTAGPTTLFLMLSAMADKGKEI